MVDWPQYTEKPLNTLYSKKAILSVIGMTDERSLVLTKLHNVSPHLKVDLCAAAPRRRRRLFWSRRLRRRRSRGNEHAAAAAGQNFRRAAGPAPRLLCDSSEERRSMKGKYVASLEVVVSPSARNASLSGAVRREIIAIHHA